MLFLYVFILYQGSAENAAELLDDRWRSVNTSELLQNDDDKQPYSGTVRINVLGVLYCNTGGLL